MTRTHAVREEQLTMIRKAMERTAEKVEAGLPKIGRSVLPQRRMANKEKYVGGRGTTEGVLRTEKRNNGRIRTSKVHSNLGSVQDISQTGCRVALKKKPTFQVGSHVRLELTTDDTSVMIDTTVMWVRVMKDCTFHIGLRFDGNDPDRGSKLLELLRSGFANEGLTRGWSPMAGFTELFKIEE